MDEKKLSKDDEKKESLEKLEEIEKAYFDLMKAYSLCLGALELKKMVWYKYFYPKNCKSTELILWGNILAPRLTKWRIRRRMDLLRVAFLLLISQKRNKNDSKIKQFELYCEDMKEISAEVKKSSSIPLYLISISAVAAILVQIVASLEDVHVNAVLSALVVAYLVVYFLGIFLLRGFMGSMRVFNDANVPEKDKKIFVLIQEYLKSE